MPTRRAFCDVGALGEAGVAGEHADPAIGHGPGCFDAVVVGRGIDYDDLDSGECLREHVGHGAADDFCPVTNGYHHTEAWMHDHQ
ncbi:MAG: hypothetical protein V9E94_00730 [Microthrixaceae bacterium]